MNTLVPLKFNKILQSKTYTALLLSSDMNEITIYTEPGVGQDLQIYLSQGKKERPSSHNLIEQILNGYEIDPIQVHIYDVKDSIYFAKLFLEKETNGVKTILEIDARPSDCITLAVLYNLPIYCRQKIIDEASSSLLD
jgi:uncharacterized protein